MKALSKIAVGVTAAVGLGFAAAAFSHGPGMGYGMGYGGPGYGPGGGYAMGMQGPYGGGWYGMHGPYAGAGFGGYGMHGPYGFAGFDENTLNERLSGLKSDLKVTGAQTKAWEAFETAVRNQAKSAAEIRASMQEGQVTPEQHYALMQAQFAGREAVWKARGELYGVLTDEQKAVFDRAGPGPYGRRGYRG